MYIGRSYAYTRNAIMRIDGFWCDDAITLTLCYNGEEISKNYKTYTDEHGRYFKYCTERVYNKFGKIIKYIYKKVYLMWFK